MRTISTAALSFGAMLTAASAVEAQETKSWSFSGDVAAVSDYRYRGVSLTDNDPALQAEATISAANGLYGYGWASSIDYADDVELMAALGWAGEIGGGFTLDAGGGVYLYPGLDDSEIYELYAIVSRPIGALTATGELAWMPAQDSLGDDDNRYVRGSLSAPLPFAEAAFNVGLGWEDGAFGDDKVDWLAGVTVPLKPLEVRLLYVGADSGGADNADDAVVAELHWKFGF